MIEIFLRGVGAQIIRQPTWDAFLAFAVVVAAALLFRRGRRRRIGGAHGLKPEIVRAGHRWKAGLRDS